MANIAGSGIQRDLGIESGDTVIFEADTVVVVVVTGVVVVVVVTSAVVVVVDTSVVVVVVGSSSQSGWQTRQDVPLGS
jgi:hypothetical protein